jgi:hypothetical protein
MALQPSDLPEELLVIIFEYALDLYLERVHLDCKDPLYELCLVNRQFYRIAQPVLYSYIDRPEKDEYKLYRTLRELPQLGLHYRHLLIDHDDPALDQQ